LFGVFRSQGERAALIQVKVLPANPKVNEELDRIFTFVAGICPERGKGAAFHLLRGMGAGFGAFAVATQLIATMPTSLAVFSGTVANLPLCIAALATGRLEQT